MIEEELLDRIYECSSVPEYWPAVLDEIAASTEGEGGLLFSANQQLHWTASQKVRDIFSEYVQDGWFVKCSRRICLMSQDSPSFFVEYDFWSENELAADPIYRDFFRPRGLGWSAGTGLRIPTGDNIVFSVERAFDRGPVERQHVEWLNALRPHLARSSLISARMHLKNVQGRSEMLEALELPALLVDHEGRVAEANSLAEKMDKLIRWTAHGGFIISDTKASKTVHEALKALGDGANTNNGVGNTKYAISAPVRSQSGQPDHVVHLVPIRRAAHDIFGPSFALIYFSPVKSKRNPGQALLRTLFDLTPSEARVASGVAEGLSVEQLAEGGDVAISTVRSQLRQVLQKTGCSRQAEVASLLTQVGATHPIDND